MSRFAIIPAAAITDTRLSLRELSVLAALGMHTDKHGWCTPSSKRLGEMLGVSGQMVRRCLQSLEDAGYLQVVHRHRDDGGQTSSRIRVLFDSEQPADAQRNLATPATSEVAGGATSEVATPATPEVAAPATSEVAPRRYPLKVPKERKSKGADAPAPLVEVPDWIPGEAWADFVAHRKSLRKPLTPKAAELAIRTLAELRSQRQPPTAVIEQSIANGWVGLFPLRTSGAPNETHRRLSASERIRENCRRSEQRELAQHGFIRD